MQNLETESISRHKNINFILTGSTEHFPTTLETAITSKSVKRRKDAIK